MISNESYKYDKYIEDGHGARWASAEEIKRDALGIDLQEKSYKAAGIPVISDGKTAYVDSEDSHAIVWGSTGSKKTRLFVLPMTNMCIRAGESFVVMDPKGEIYKNSVNNAKENGYKVIVLNLRDLGCGDRWNPLGIPCKLYREGRTDEATNMANDFVDILMGDRKNEKDVFWPQMASNYLLAHMLLLFSKGDENVVNMKSVARLCTADAEKGLKELLQYMNKSSMEYTAYNVVLNTAERTRSSITSYAYSAVSMFSSQQQLAATLATTSFSMEAIAKEKTAVYLVVPDEKETYHFLASLFVKQLYTTMIGVAQKEENGRIPVRMNFILDEFCNMPTIPDMVSMITAARSRNMRFYLFVQGLHQLKGKYEECAETIKGNCDDWFFLNSREYELLDEISKLCGTRKKNGSEEPLISTSELQHLSKEKGECVVFYHRNYPFVAQLADISEYEMFANPCKGSRCGEPFEAACDVVDMNRLAKAFGVKTAEEKRREQIEKIRQLTER